MTRTGPRKPVEPGYGDSRLRIARSYRQGAQALLAVAGNPIGNPVVSLVVSAAIAYADALTARFGNSINQEDHRAVVKALRSALGNRFPAPQERVLRRILEKKPLAQYGARLIPWTEAEKLCKDLDLFAEWAEAAWGELP